MITGNAAESDSVYEYGGGIFGLGEIDIANSIVAGNVEWTGKGHRQASDIRGSIALSDGHNLFGSSIAGAVEGDLTKVASSALFASIDPLTGGGLLGANGIVMLLGNAANPALSGADPLAVMPTAQLGGARPSPAASLADIGSVEISQAPSTTASTHNDVLTGTAAANTLSGLAGNDLLRGRAGNDTLSGGNGSDLLEGGAGNDKLDGGGGIDLVTYAGSKTAVVVDLSGNSDTARQGTATDTLLGIEGAIGSDAGDTFKGDGLRNLFQGGAGRDLCTGGAGRDLFDYDSATHSAVGANRDVITDFVHLVDDLDLMGIDADPTRAGDQAFRFVGTAALSATPGEVGWYSSGGNTIVRGSIDADAQAESRSSSTASCS
jgi:serralysin